MTQMLLEFKRDLCKARQWSKFVEFREELKASGMKASKACGEAMAVFGARVEAFKAKEELPAIPEISTIVGIAPPEDEIEKDLPGSAAGAVRCLVSQKAPASLPGDELGDDRKAYCELAGREADILEVISWVAKHLDEPKKFLRMSDAPSAAAWGMALSYRRSALRRDEFWDKVYTRLIPSRAQLENRTDFTVDGEEIARTCERILELKRRTEGGD